MTTLHLGDCLTDCLTCSKNYHEQFVGKTCDACHKEIEEKVEMIRLEKITQALADAEEQLALAQEEEDRTEEAMDSMERTYWEGQTEALRFVVALLKD